MRRRLWRWLRYALAALLLVLVGASVLVFNPERQKAWLVPQVQPLVDQLALDYVFITPWSVELRGVSVSAQGAAVSWSTLDLGFNPLALLWDTVSISRLTLAEAKVDLHAFVAPPSAPSTAPFPGVLTAFDQGYALALDKVAVDAQVLLPETGELKIGLGGGGVRPHFPGGIDYSLQLSLAPDQRVAVAGALTLDQLTAGALRKLGLAGKVDLQWTGLPAAEQVEFALEVAPQEGAGGARYRARRARAAGLAAEPPPEALQLRLKAPGASGAEDRASVAVAAVYEGLTGQVAGTVGVQTTNGLLTPYTADLVLPDIANQASGSFSFNTVNSNFDLDLINTVALSALPRVLGENPLLPGSLRLRSAVTLAGQPARIAVTRFEHALSPDAAVPVLQLRLGDALLIDPAHPEALLAAPRALGTLEITDLPLPWANGVLGGATLHGGLLRAGWEVAVDDQQRVVVSPITPLSTGAFSARQDGKTLVDGLSLSVQPSLRKSAQSIRVWLDQLTVQHQSSQLLGGALRLRQPVDAAESPRFDASLKVDLDAIKALPVVAENLQAYPLPGGLGASAELTLRLPAGQLGIEALDLRLAQSNAPDLLRIKAEKPFSLSLDGKLPSLHNANGTLARIALRGLDLAWLNPFVPHTTLSGRLTDVEMLLAAQSSDALSLRSASPLKLKGVGVIQGQQKLLERVDFAARPEALYQGSKLSASVKALSIAGYGKRVLDGEVGVNTDLAGSALRAEGKLALDINQLLRQPALATALGKRRPALKADAALDFAFDFAAPLLKVERLLVKLNTNRQAALALTAQPGLEIRTSLAKSDQLARAVVGSADLDIRDVSGRVIREFVPLDGVDFADFDADFRLISDGVKLRAEGQEPMRLSNVKLTGEGKSPLAPFGLEAAVVVGAEGRQLALDLNRLQLSFVGQGSPALDAHAKARIEPDRPTPLQQLELAISANLPQWLSQPAVMPGHRLTGGALNATLDVNARRSFTARVGIDGLAASKPLAISALALPITGKVAADGRGFRFDAPLVAQGNSGASNAQLTASFAPVTDEADMLDLELDSAVFYLNDLLKALAQIAPPEAAPAAPPPTAAPSKTTAAAPTPLDETRDAKAVWDVMPYGARLRFDIKKLFYTDYLAFDDVGGELNVRRRRLSLSDFRARFHDSPITLDGGLRFRRDAPEPYTLALNGAVKDFDLQTFSSELVPGEKPQVEGLFGMTIEASGEMPNLGQLRNRAYFDVHMQSRDGVFRPLPPSSTLLLGASEVLGVIGEGLSYAPTGGFGAGAVARLVNYISRINYDLIEIRLRRGSSKRVRLSRFVVQSPTILLNAAGAVDYVEGLDLLDRPLDLKGSLNMRARGAAILYSMNLMREGRDEYGYFKGPEFLITGTPAAPESNFAAIIQQAGKGTVQGGVTRPLSGLIGNFKYRWFGPKDRPTAVAPPSAAELE